MAPRKESVRMSSEHATIDESSELVNRVIHGDERALAELFDVQRPRLRRIVNFRLDRRIYGRVGADDVLQEAYLNACGQLKALSARASADGVYLAAADRQSDAGRRPSAAFGRAETDRPSATFRFTAATRPPRPPNGSPFICWGISPRPARRRCGPNWPNSSMRP